MFDNSRMDLNINVLSFFFFYFSYFFNVFECLEIIFLQAIFEKEISFFSLYT